MKNLDYDYCPLQFNDVLGLTCYKDVGDSIGRSRMVLCLKRGVIAWCEDNLSQCPRLQTYRATKINGRRIPGKVWLRFGSDEDRMLFQIRFAHHFMPAAMSHAPFDTTLD